MTAKVPIRTVFDGEGNATGLAEFQSGEFVDYSHGGTGVTSLGTAGQVLKVNSGATALEFGSVEAIVNIDGATDLTGSTLEAADQILASDNGTEGRVTLGQLDTLFSGTSKTLTNKTIDASSNTLSNIANSSLTNSSFSIIDDSSTSESISLGNSLTFTGGSGINTTVTSGNLTIDFAGIDLNA